MVNEKNPVAGQNQAREIIKVSKDKDESFFVGISKPKELRRDMLEALRDTISLLQKAEKIKKVRAARYDSIMNLKSKINEIETDLANLEQLIPKYNFEIKKILPTEQKPNIKFKPMATTLKTKNEEIDLLERELAEVEAKLKLL